MSNLESQPTSTSAGAKLHEVIVDHAQRYVYRTESVQNICASLEDYADEYRSNSSELTKDQEFETIQRMRIGREAILAAVGRVVSDEIIKKALSYSTDEELDVARMTKNIKPIYCDGMVSFLDETVDGTLYAMADSHHPDHDLFQHAFDFETGYLTLLGNHTKKTGAIATIVDPYSTLMAMFTDNYHSDVASFLVTQGISIQDQYEGDLPSTDVVVEAIKETRPHWLAMTALSRLHIGGIYFGKERYRAILEVADRTGDFPTWSTLWPLGIAMAMADNEAPFQTCPMQSPLLRRAPGDPIVDKVKSPGRCAGQIALYGSSEANNNAVRLSKFVGGNLTETGRYSPAALLVDLGSTASRLSFSDPSFRKALTYAKVIRDQHTQK
jgi:hypothetical protein